MFQGLFAQTYHASHSQAVLHSVPSGYVLLCSHCTYFCLPRFLLCLPDFDTGHRCFLSPWELKSPLTAAIVRIAEVGVTANPHDITQWQLAWRKALLDFEERFAMLNGGWANGSSLAFWTIAEIYRAWTINISGLPGASVDGYINRVHELVTWGFVTCLLF